MHHYQLCSHRITAHIFYHLFFAVPTLSLSSESYVVVENEGSVEVCVELNLPLSFALDFTLTPIDTGSATAGTMVSNATNVSIETFVILGNDFNAGRLNSFLSPGATQRCIDIGVINDNTALEGNELFSVVLATVFFPVPIDVSIAQVTIVDTDCKYSYSLLSKMYL